MGAIDGAAVSKILNATLPVGGTAGNPGTAFGTLSATAMKLRLGLNAPTESTAMTQITGGSGYTTDGQAFSDIASSQASSAGSTVSLPKTTPFSWTNSSTAWSIVGLEVWDGTPTRYWYGSWNGQPIGVATGNTFQVAALALVFSLT
jgi:hypothetical protein